MLRGNLNQYWVSCLLTFLLHHLLRAHVADLRLSHRRLLRGRHGSLVPRPAGDDIGNHVGLLLERLGVVYNHRRTGAELGPRGCGRLRISRKLLG